jgi:MFS family permease
LAHPTLAARAALVVLGVWLNAADTLVTATLMPSVARDFHAFSGFGLAVAGYLTGAIVAGASAGRLSERLGLRPSMALAGLAYGAGCLMSALGSLPLRGRPHRPGRGRRLDRGFLLRGHRRRLP